LYSRVASVQLENVSVRVRPRSSWEAIDLGLRLVQGNARAIYQPFLILTLPIFILLNLLFFEHMWAAVLIFWWLKPMYDRLVLHVISHSLFGETPTWRETLRAFPGTLRHGLFLQLTLLRIDPSRSFRLPVLQLEGLKGKARGERMRVLQARGNTNAVWLTITCMHLEYAINFALFALVYMLMPQNIGAGVLSVFFAEVPPFWADLASNFFYFLTVCMIEPFYVAAGFMLYINRRSQLEAWDIELVFRRMAARLRALSSSVAAMLAITLILTLPQPGLADVPGPALQVEESARVITEVLAHEDFATSRTEERWKLRDFDWDWLDDEEEEEDQDIPDLGWLSGLAPLIKWLVIAAFVGWLAWMLVRYRDEFNGLIGGHRRRKDELPEVVMGMDIRPESLPEDIPAEARSLWQQGHIREALGLLYRAALSRLVNHRGLEISSGDTEADILSIARSGLDQNGVQYLSGLTGAWQLIAYAHRQPDQQVFERLVDDWSSRFDTLAADS
jgi:hypothetical protein